MTILEQYVAIQEEASYGTAAVDALKGYESRVDGWQRDVIHIEGGGRHPGRSGQQANRRRQVDRGATGRIESVLLTAGEGLRLKHLLGSFSAAPVGVSGSTGAYRIVLEADTAGPTGSYTTVVARSDTEDVMRYFQYEGCLPTAWGISVEEGGELTLGVDYDSKKETVLSDAPDAPTYPDAAGSDMFIFEDCALMLDGASVTSFRSFSLDASLMLDTGRFKLRGSADKDKPIRNGVPTFEGSISGDFMDLTEYERFVAGEPISLSLTATALSVIGSTTQNPTFQITLPAVQYNGSTPQSSLDGVSTIEVPFTALSNADNKICSIEYISADSDY